MAGQNRSKIGRPRRGAPARPPPARSAQQRNGQKLVKHRCSTKHHGLTSLFAQNWSNAAVGASPWLVCCAAAAAAAAALVGISAPGDARQGAFKPGCWRGRRRSKPLSAPNWSNWSNRGAAAGGDAAHHHPVFAGQTPLVKQLVKHRCGRKTGQTPLWAKTVQTGQTPLWAQTSQTPLRA